MKKNKLMLGLLSLLTILAFFVGGSYAIFNPVVIGNDTASTQVMKSGAIEITYNGTNSINISTFEPGDSTTATFTVKNTGSLTQSGYEISFGSISNKFINSEIVYSLSCVADEGICSGKTQTAVPLYSGLIMNGSSIAPGVTHSYTLTVSFIDTGSNQEYNKNKTLSFYIHINQTETYPVLRSRGGGGEFWAYSSTITEITFDISSTAPAGTISDQGNLDNPSSGKIKWYLVGTHLYIHGEATMIAPSDCSLYFYNFPNLTTINNLNYILTFNVTNFNQFFSYCDNLAAVDISEWDFSNVTNTSAMFYECWAIKTIRLDIASFTNVSTYGSMFVYIPSDSENKGNIYVKDQTAADWIYARLVDAGGNRHLNNNIIIVT